MFTVVTFVTEKQKQAQDSEEEIIMIMKKISKVKIALITLTAIVALVVVKVLTAQFLYTEMGYSPVETQQEFRNALSVSPFTATAFNNGYTYE